MSFIQATALSLAFGDRDILKSVHINLSSTTRAALSGGNGSGKSTLMKILAGMQHADYGSINLGVKTKIAYLPQTGIIHSGSTLKKECETAFNFVQKLIKKKEALEKELQSISKENPKLELLLEQQYSLEQKIEKSGYYERNKKIEQILKGLGFKENDFEKNCELFSGGWQMRIALTVCLLKNPDILLLDEPTNYLDLEAREWLTHFLKTSQGGYLLVSHDRYFLDETVNEIYEIFNGNLKRYKGTYSQYEFKRKEKLETLIKLYKKQQDEIQKNEQFIRRFRATATKASAVQSRVKQLDKITRIKLPDNMKKVSIQFPPPPHCGENTLKIENLSKKYKNNTVFLDLNFHIKKGEKVAISGENGAGKTTLLKIIAKVISSSNGTVQIGTGIKMGYFAQDSNETLHDSLSIEKEIEQDCPTSMIPKIRTLAGAFLFSDDDIYKKVGILSGGERNRLKLLKLMLQPYNLLLLDEPTNHLDIHSKDLLLEALKNYEGTVLFVSHDRYFLENLASRVIHLENGKLKDYPGNYEYYLYRLEQENLDICPKQKNKKKNNEVLKKTGLTHQQQKEIRNQVKALEKNEELQLQRIEKLETELENIQKKLMQPEIYSNSQEAKKVVVQQQKIEQKIIEETKKWEKYSKKLEELK